MFLNSAQYCHKAWVSVSCEQLQGNSLYSDDYLIFVGILVLKHTALIPQVLLYAYCAQTRCFYLTTKNSVQCESESTVTCI